jgi:hypothetical protein
MLRRLLILLLAAWAGLAALCPGAYAEPVFPLGVRVGLEPPGDLKLSKQFPGFEDVERQVTITILDLPASAYVDLESSAFAKNQVGVTGLKRETFPFASGVGILVTGQSDDNGVTLDKWFLLGNVVVGKVRDLAMLISVQVPVAARAVYSDAVIRKALASVTFRPPPIQEQLGLLPFKLTELAGFRVVQALPAGAAILTEGPTDDLSRQPYVVVSVGRGAPENPDERGNFARDLLSSAPLRDLTVTSAEAMRINGGQGYEIRARAVGLLGNPVLLAQWVRFGSGGFLRVVGVSPRDEWDQMFTRFRAVRDGVEPR